MRLLLGVILGIVLTVLGAYAYKLDDGTRSERIDAFRGQRTAADGELGCGQR